MMPVSKYRNTKLSIAMTLAVFSAGCAVSTASQNDAEVEKQTTALNDLAKPATPVVHDAAPPLEISKLPDAQQEEKERAWLRKKAFSYQPKNAVPANIVLKMFREKGINITSTLPLDNYVYNGNGVVAMDGETAIRLIFGQMGLDYEVNNRDQYVTIVPMKSHTWTINLGNRKSHSTAASFDNVCNISSSQTSQNVTTGSASSGNGTSNNQNGNQNQNKTSAEGGDSSVETKNDFWTSLKAEFAERVKVLVPTNAASGAQQAQQTVPQPMVPGITTPQMMQNRAQASASQPGSTSMYTPVVMGQFSMNPETGSVTVQAPRWMLKQIDAYMEDILAMFNTSMTFEGKIVNVRSSSDRTTGFDLSALGRFAGKYGVVISNNILGGVTLSGSSVSYGGSATLPGGGSTLGIVSDSDNLRIFNAFLKTIGGTQTVSEPLLTVTTGVPADFGRLTPYYTNEPSQELSAGNVNTNSLAVTKNNIIEHRYGSLLKIMPHYDPKTKRVRAQISLLQKPLVGFQTIPTYLTDAKGGTTIQNIRKPQIECSVTSTEAILDDGELIVIGGQVDNSNDTSHSGTDGLMDVKVLDWFTSSKRETTAKTTSYFAIRVRLNKKPQMATQEW